MLYFKCIRSELLAYCAQKRDSMYLNLLKFVKISLIEKTNSFQKCYLIKKSETVIFSLFSLPELKSVLLKYLSSLYFFWSGIILTPKEKEFSILVTMLFMLKEIICCIFNASFFFSQSCYLFPRKANFLVIVDVN